MRSGVHSCRGFITWDKFKVGPKWAVLKPFLTQGFAVSIRTLTVIGVIMSSTSVLARIGAVSQASHEILRQLWIFLFQFVECINISNQSIVATALGAKDFAYAFQVVKRHLLYAVAIVSVVALLVLAFQVQLTCLFTRDAAVIAMVATTMPLLTAFFPFDAMSSILDGTLTAAGQATWTAKNATVGTLATFAILTCAEKMTQMSVLKVWMCLKMMTVFRLPLLVHRTFQSLVVEPQSQGPVLAIP
jgi:Na+-driven multidrug efflux pump